ncbi:hypothetical protein [Lacticaseibacillus manihotivorans]|nr:hypothetical protein [Lacticaseibacillus manihotivorans]QFQ89963.1 hypothetical protein LM010_00250 [Lacticaseibacillus manihotivorans]
MTIFTQPVTFFGIGANMTQINVDLGQYINQFRRDRGITLKALAPGSESNLSRFLKSGRGTSMTLMNEAMSRMGLQYVDLMTAFPRFESAFTTAAETLISLRFDWQATQVRKVVMNYIASVSDAKDVLTALNRQVLRSILQACQTHQNRLFSKSLQQAIVQTLEQNTDWLLYDYLLLRLSVSFCDTSMIMRSYRLMVAQGDVAQDYVPYRDDVMQQMALVLWVRNETSEVSMMVERLATSITRAYSFHDELTARFIALLVETHGDEDSLQHGLVEFNAVLDALALQRTKTYFQQLIMMAGSEQGVLL